VPGHLAQHTDDARVLHVHDCSLVRQRLCHQSEWHVGITRIHQL